MSSIRLEDNVEEVLCRLTGSTTCEYGRDGVTSTATPLMEDPPSVPRGGRRILFLITSPCHYQSLIAWCPVRLPLIPLGRALAPPAPLTTATVVRRGSSTPNPLHCRFAYVQFILDVFGFQISHFLQQI